MTTTQHCAYCGDLLDEQGRDSEGSRRCSESDTGKHVAEEPWSTK